MENTENKEVKTEVAGAVDTNDTVITDTYTKEIDVPSNGYLGGPSKITIRAMRTSEEKILNSENNSNYLNKLCKACTIKPKNLDWKTLTPNDYQFILFQLRELTYGPIYKQPIVCPFCGRSQDAEINIASFEYDLLEKDIESKLFVELPISKAQVHLKLLSQDEIDKIDNEAEELARKGLVSDASTHAIDKKFAAMVDTISGEEFKTDQEKFAFVQNMHLADFNAIRNAIGNIRYGLNNVAKVTCQNSLCGQEVEVLGTVCPEFFHPTI